MPRRSPSPCRVSDCPELVYDGSGYCEQHKAEQCRFYDAQRGTAAQRGYDNDWQQISTRYLGNHPVCERCKQRRSEIVHHIVRKRMGGSDESLNLMAVCRLCHAQVHAQSGELFGGG